MLEPGKPLLVMLSGGADSVCLLDLAQKRGADVSVLHVNYGLRKSADGDEQFCRELFPGLIVEHVRLPAGANVQAAARDARYALAEQHAVGDYATGHTMSDQAETVLMRLASSPGRRGLLGMAPRRGRLVRPLLGMTRAETEAYCREAGLSWREDPSNSDPRYTRARVRHELLPLLERIAPGAERTIAETSRLLRDESEALDALLPQTNDLGEIAALPAALGRLVLRRLAGAPVRVDQLLAYDGRGGSFSLDVGQGLRAVVEYGRVRFDGDAPGAAPEPISLAAAGRVRFGDWEVDASAPATVRSWRPGDRIRMPGGTKKLQDLFTDRKVPREERARVPVVEAGGEIVCVGDLAGTDGFTARRVCRRS
ncbi:MAG: tRNA(Ile)-lysidine synthase [Solirubrobacteraceae bacterium]|nr:tRNA(Ile)-lysidine synthase [Solirubrobacteraceae bacterium]